MDTKSKLIENAKNLFQQKGYKGVGVNEILKACNITKGALYHHFPDGKEALLIACLDSMKEVITSDIAYIFKQHQTAQTALHAVLEKLAADFDKKHTIVGYTFSSIISEMASLNEPVRNACASLYASIQALYADKLVADGFSEQAAQAVALLITSTIEGGMMLCLTQHSNEPLKNIARALPNLMKEF